MTNEHDPGKISLSFKGPDFCAHYLIILVKMLYYMRGCDGLKSLSDS